MIASKQAVKLSNHKMTLKMKLKGLILLPTLLLGLTLSNNVEAQTGCDPDEKAKATACCASAGAETTSGCAPSSCRGAKTKFGEAKVITSLRADLIDLKTDMEKSKSPRYSERSYDIHGIIGETDEESIEIIVRELEVMEKEISGKTNHRFETLNLPESKARQIQYLNQRVKALKGVLSKSRA